MKIKKLIKEAEENREETLADVNPQEASVSEIADAAQNSVEKITDDEATLSDAKAEKVADEIKDTAQEIDAGQAAILPAESEVVEENAVNELTKILDRAYAASKRNMARGGKTGANVLVTGLPGSGKTAIVYAWAKSKGCNIHYLDSKDPNLETVINGMPLRDITVQDKNLVAKAYSNSLAPLHRPNSILFLDELNRQVKPHIRASLLTLINEKEISGTDETGHESFRKSLLFTIACINPAVPTDKGAAELNDAEKSRFTYQLKDFDSKPANALDFYNKHYSFEIKKHKATKDAWIKNYIDENKATQEDAEKAWKEELVNLIKIKDILIYIVSHPIFAFDTREDLESLADGQHMMLNQRSLTEAVEDSLGDKTLLLEWIDEFSDLLPRDADMLKEILSTYTLDLNALLKAEGVGQDTDSKETTSELETPAEPEAEEDDADFFTQSNTEGPDNLNALPGTVAASINDVIGGWSY